jgi:nucleoid-associated protein EbfC
MINPFKQIGEVNKMRSQAMQIQKDLQQEEVDIEKNGVRVVISGDQKIKKLESNDRSDSDVAEAINEAIKKSQEVAAKKLQQMGGLGGLLGGQ